MFAAFTRESDHAIVRFGKGFGVGFAAFSAVYTTAMVVAGLVYGLTVSWPVFLGYLLTDCIVGGTFVGMIGGIANWLEG